MWSPVHEHEGGCQQGVLSAQPPRACSSSSTRTGFFRCTGLRLRLDRALRAMS